MSAQLEAEWQRKRMGDLIPNRQPCCGEILWNVEGVQAMAPAALVLNRSSGSRTFPIPVCGGTVVGTGMVIKTDEPEKKKYHNNTVESHNHRPEGKKSRAKHLLCGPNYAKF